MPCQLAQDFRLDSTSVLVSRASFHTTGRSTEPTTLQVLDGRFRPHFFHSPLSLVAKSLGVLDIALVIEIDP